MDKTLKKLLWTSVITLIVVVILGVIFLLSGGSNPPTISFGSIGNKAIDVIGTRVGTTTTGIDFGTATTTKFYPVNIGIDIDAAMFSIKTTSVLAPNPGVNIEIVKSNDSSCETATTTTVMNVPTASQINWYDQSMHLYNVVNTRALSAATNTITWYPTTAGQGKEIMLDNLGVRCIGFNVSASGTTLFAQLVTKQY